MSVFLQLTTQNMLLCSQCSLPLSRFPIYTSLVTEDSICGRCPLPVCKQYMQNKVYENIASNNKFACRYKSSGCVEYLFPSQVEKHEKFCKYRIYSCVLIKEHCTWKGTSSEFLDHFEEKHSIFILQDAQFEVDFVNSHNENYLMLFADDLFVVTRKADSKARKISCQVSYMGPNHQADEYNYILTFKSASDDRTHKVIKKVNTSCEFDGDELNKLLNNPTMIVAQIDIREKDKSHDNDDVNDNVDYEDLTEYECPVCFEYLLTPIFQCDIGHSICGSCKEDFDKQEKNECPTCKSPFGKTRNFALENIILKKVYPCKYPKCKFSCKGRDIRQHQATCIYGPYKCPLHETLNCTEKMAIFDVYDHVVNNHYEYLLEFDAVDTPFENENEEFTECFILQYSLRLFRLVFQYEDKKLFWSMQLLGQAEECAKFKFEIDISDKENENRVYLKGSCSPFSSIHECFDEGKTFLYLTYGQVKSFISGKLFYRVTITNK